MLNIKTHHYSFGSPIPGRQFTSSSGYRYGFNGKENDNETVGTFEGTQDYGMRIYNPALGRFLSIDPLISKYPELTPYQFASNSPVVGIDLDGLEICIITSKPEGVGKLIGSLMVYFTTSLGEQQIKELNKSQHLNTMYIGDKKNQYKDYQIDFDKNNIDAYAVAHEVDHFFWDRFYKERGQFKDRKFSENSAVRAENMLRAVLGGKNMRTEYDFPDWDFTLPGDMKFSNNPEDYNFGGEKVTLTGSKILSKIDKNDNYKFNINKYSADSKEITEATSGIILFYDYQKDKDSPVEKMAVKLDIIKEDKSKKN